MKHLSGIFLALLLVASCVPRYDDIGDVGASGKDKGECDPSADDQVGDGIDQNCDGMDGVDADGDGYASVASGGDDCDDGNAAAFPGGVDFVEGSCANVQMDASTEVVDDEGDTGYYSTSTMDSDGNLWVAYRTAFEETSDQVKLARKVAGQDDWEYFTVYEGTGRYISLTVVSGKIHVAFHDADNKRLLYMSTDAANPGAGQWSQTVVDDSTGDPGRYASLAVDSAGNVHVTCWNKGLDDLLYATNASGAFVVTPVAGKEVVDLEEERAGQFSSMTLDSLGKAHIATYNATFESLEYITNAGGGWSRTTVDASKPQIGKYTSIATDSKGAVHISYRDKLLEDLRYASNSTGTWTVDVVDGESAWVGSDTAIVIDVDDNVHITYNQGDADYLRYATRRENQWSKAIVEQSLPCGLQNSLVIDGGVAHIFTGHNNLGQMLHVTVELNCLEFDMAGDTNCDGVDGFDGDLDGFASLDSGGNDCDDEDFDIQPGWVTRVVADEESNVGEFASLAIDAQNIIHASYFAALSQNLKYARREPDGNWVIETAHADGNNVGQYSAIAVSAVEPDDLTQQALVHIAYYNDTTGELWHAVRQDGIWTPEVVHATPEAGENVGRYASIAVDENGVVHIAYADVLEGKLLYATNHSGTWVNMEVPNDGDAGEHTSIAVEDGQLYIAYLAGSTDDLMLAEAALPLTGPGDWGDPELVDGNTSSVGEAVSLAVDGKDRVHITYRDSTARTLQYALRRSGKWSLRTVDTEVDMSKWSSLDLDGNSMVHVAYKDMDSDSLLYATNVVTDNNLWFMEAVNGVNDDTCGGLTTECGDYAALQFDTIGRLHALHYDTINKRLLYSRKSCLGY